MVEGYSFVKSVYSSGSMSYSRRGTLSVGLTKGRGAEGFEGDPAGANPSVVVMNINEPYHSVSP